MIFTQFPALKLFVLLIIFSIAFALLDFDIVVISVFVCIAIISSIILIYKNYNSLAYVLIIIAVSSLVSKQINYFETHNPRKIIQDESAVFSGEINEVLSVKENYIRYLAVGKLKVKSLSKIDESKILLTVFNPKFIALPGESITSNLKVQFLEGEMPNSKFSMRKYMQSNEIDFSAISYGNQIHLLDQTNDFLYFSYFLRNNIQRKIYELFSEDYAGVISALITGDKSMIDKEVKQNFVLSGTAHILAVSGLHVGIIAFIIFSLLSFIKNNWIKSILSVLLLFLFVYMTGFLTSAVRAALMISVYILLMNFERYSNPQNSMGIAALILFFANPNIIFSVSFQMSFLAVFGILTLYSIIYIKFDYLIKKYNFLSFIISPITITVSSSILLSPLIAYYFGIFSIISPIANLIVIPLMVLSLSLGICALFLSFISNYFADIFAISSSILIDISNKINEYLLSFDFSYIAGADSFWIALISSIVLLYIILAKNTRILLFRTVISLFLYYFAVQNISNMENDINIIAKKNLTAIVLNQDSEKSYILLFDRHEKPYSYKDYDVLNYINDFEKDLTIAFSGDFGLKTIDNAKKMKDFTHFKLNSYEQKLLIKLLELDTEPAKLIEY